jgi:transposase
MALLHGERRQTVMFPASIDEYVAADDPVRAYDAFVEQLDFAALGIAWDADRVGAPEYDPKAMLKLLVYGYSYGIRSSRKLERATVHNLSFIWLLGGLAPDHKTIARFRRNHRAALARVLKQCAQMCLRLELIDGNTLFVDGTKLRANASFSRDWTTKKGVRLLEKLDQRIAEILAACETTDRTEDGLNAPGRLPAALRGAQALKERVQGVLQELACSAQQSINTTDRDCRRMKSRQGAMVGYNVQAVVDDRQGLIVHADVVSDQNDVQQFAHQIEQANEVVGGVCAVACADAGYANTEELKRLSEQEITVIVPSQDQARRTPRGPFDRDKFVYDAPQDCYRCPAGNVLGYRRTDLRAGRNVYRITHASICHGCASWGVCTRAKRGRAIVKPIDDALKQQFEAEYAKPESQAIYRRRKERAELPFGHLKWNLGVQSFLLRGLSGVRAETSILATCFNMKRAVTLLGVPGLLRAWGTA